MLLSTSDYKTRVANFFFGQIPMGSALFWQGLLLFLRYFSHGVAYFDQVANFYFQYSKAIQFRICRLKICIHEFVQNVVVHMHFSCLESKFLLHSVSSSLELPTSDYKTRVANFLGAKSPLGWPYFDRVCYFFWGIFPMGSLNMTRSLICFWRKNPWGRQFWPGLIIGSGKYLISSYDGVFHKDSKSVLHQKWWSAPR